MGRTGDPRRTVRGLDHPG
ncbi:unnamed protein product [Callosobruchus maculatus]|uniref:Uncharacterized protein n=1 Tax=Callosobruchus maculatus TaxID=64391 RepID=A0A653CPG5_CALMS|nr:unnamed protein product [Callosobruchus maculatus]